MLEPIPPAKLHLEDGQGQVVMLKLRLPLSCRMCWFLCQLSCEKTGGMRRKWWVAEGCERQNKLFIWFAGQYVRILFASILHPHPPAAMRNTLHPLPILSCNRILSGLPPPFHFISLTSSFLSTQSLYNSAQLQREERGVGSFLWESAGQGTDDVDGVFPPLASTHDLLPCLVCSHVIIICSKHQPAQRHD